jgi:uncharacterized protein YndB with AHSA1/START domain
VTAAEEERDVVVSRWIAAPPETVFSFFQDPALWLRWQGVRATIEPRPGGRFRMDVRGDGWASGSFLEVRPPERLVFTWGWEERPDLPPGSTTVEIDLVADGDGTRLTLRHRHLPGVGAVEQHRAGWAHYLDRLAVAAAGGDPGPDPTALPAHHEEDSR